ncbi:MAG TPA: M23 family metallopeptidase [Kofleriaceae bacterium]|nr:M23 family metallopeptidase [Kofleriaceae bacterium]
MSTAAAIRTSLTVCPRCGGAVDVKTRHVVVAGGSVQLYCSASCLAARDAPPAPPEQIVEPPRPRRLVWWLAGGIVVGASLWLGLDRKHVPVSMPPSPAIESVSELDLVETPTTETPVDGVEQPDIDLDEITHDAWIHPLAGPTRRMPVNHNGAFGAVRDGVRAPECLSGHCGVDLGHDWGEPVHAAHDGVVDWVERGPNEEHGGIFVRLSHRGGTLFSWYFHLAAVPKSIHPGVKVTMGQVIGLLGDTGIKHSAPHLHFAMSVKTGAHAERYLDPEPLIAIWPLWIANENGGRVSTAEAPGVPVREISRRRSVPTAPTVIDVSAPAMPAPEVENTAAPPPP